MSVCLNQRFLLYNKVGYSVVDDRLGKGADASLDLRSLAHIIIFALRSLHSFL